MTTQRDLPAHVAIIMDGNGRWAKQRGLLRFSGHRAGVKVAKTSLKFAAKRNINVISLFAFSSENWKRPKKEVSFLMDLFLKLITIELQELHESNVKILVTGDLSVFSNKLCQAIDNAKKMTEKNTGIVLNIVFNYGGRWDIVRAAQQLAERCMSGELTPEEITEQHFSQSLSMADLPDPDLMIRTSGESRISNFFLWQLAYAELYFCDCNWPDFSLEEFDRALEWYKKRERRFGVIDTQATKEEQ